MWKQLKSLFGGAAADAGRNSGTAPVQHEEDYKGFHIVVAPSRDGGQYRVGGRIYRTDQPDRVHTLVRADQYPSLDVATEQTLMKARQAVDQLGDRLFQ